MRRSSSIAALTSVLALVVAACGPSAAPETSTTSTLAPVTTIAPTTTTMATTTVPPSTTTTEAQPAVSEGINGVPVSDPSTIDRRTVAIKISNSPEARPQSGLMEADIVYEILVEGGLTRFLAVFQSEDLDWVGPVRSGRPTDAEVVRPYDGPFQVSGAQPWVKDIFASKDLKMIYDTGVTTWREHHRSAPHNLYTSTLLIRDYADERGWNDDNPGNMFAFGEPTESDEEATEIVLDWSAHPPVRWVWNGEVYERFNADVPHPWITKDGDTGIVSTPVLVVITGDRYTASPSGSGSSVPAIHTVGSGPVQVFMNGTVVEGTWSRDADTVPFTLTTDDGSEIVLPPSKIFVAIFPDTRTVSWS
ncbi:MAG: DUF3048 domain-containing protein [Acidimicrobiia bacterium]|nr:DUF3048 domain-containing protein [Acidimicrobiia bacterium]